MSKYGHRPHNWFEAIVNKLGGEEAAEAFLRSELDIKPRVHTIDCDTEPFLPEERVTVEVHHKDGKLDWDALNTCLIYRGPYTKADVIREQLKGQPVLNANVLHYLLAHPYLIPRNWCGHKIFFWGTIYRDQDGRLFVLYLQRFSPVNGENADGPQIGWEAVRRLLDRNLSDHSKTVILKPFQEEVLRPLGWVEH